MNGVEELLKKEGPMLSGDLARLYEEAYGVSNESARKAISRAKSPVQKLHGIRFEKNQVFCYLNSQFMKKEYSDALLNAISEHSKVICTYVQAFILQSGVISKSILPAFTSSPVGKVQRHRRFDDVLRQLTDAQIITDGGDGTCTLSPAFCENFNAKRARGLEIAKNVIVRDFNAWAKSINLVAYGQGKCLFDKAEFGQFRWAYTAPSYVQPLFSHKTGKNGFVIADVVYGRTATKETVDFFLQKIRILRSFKNIPPFMPVLLTDKVDNETLTLLKENKVTVALLNNLFSDKYTELLNDLVNVFTKATEILSNEPEQIRTLFSKIEKSEGRYNNLAGDLFELLVGSHFSYVGCQGIRSQAEVTDYETGRKKEIDLLVFKDGKSIVVECKAQKSKLDGKFVRKWLNENIPHIRKCLLQNGRSDKTEFQLWSVGGFDGEAIELLKKAEENKKYTVRYFDRDGMLAIAKETADGYFTDILKKHFAEK